MKSHTDEAQIANRFFGEEDGGRGIKWNIYDKCNNGLPTGKSNSRRRKNVFSW